MILSPMQVTGMNRTELVERFFDFLERERLGEERLGAQSLEEPRSLQRSALQLLLVLCGLISLFVVFTYWRKKYGVAMADDEHGDNEDTDDKDDSMIGFETWCQSGDLQDLSLVELWAQRKTDSTTEQGEPTGGDKLARTGAKNNN